jgi:hypothetical protein
MGRNVCGIQENKVWTDKERGDYQYDDEDMTG